MMKALSGLIVGLLWIAGSLGVLAQGVFWQPTNGPGGGRVYDLAATPQGDVYATVNQGFLGTGFYRSEDDGATWTALPIPDAFMKLVVGPSGRLFAPLGDHLYFSNDRAQNWHVSVFADVRIKTLTFGAAGRIFAGTDKGVYRTDNVEAGWDAAGLDSVNVLDLLYTATGSLVVVSGNYVFRSDDDGATWRSVASFDPVITRPFVSATLAEHPGGDVYIGTSGFFIPGFKIPGVFRLSESDSLARAGLDFFSVNTLVMVDEGLLVAATGGINGGLGIRRPAGVFAYRIAHDAWTSAGLSSTPVNDLVMTASGAYVAGTRGLSDDIGNHVGRGLVRAPGGRDFSWAFAGQGIVSAETYALATGAGLVCAAADYSVFCSENQGDLWIPVYTLPPDHDAEDPPLYRGIVLHPSGDIFVRPWTGNLLRSQDQGATWTALAPESLPDLPPPLRYFSGMQPYQRDLMVMTPGGTLLLGDDDEIWRSPDRGETWQQIVPGEPGVPVIALAAAPTGRLFALTQVQSSPYINLEEASVFTSDDDGLSWTFQAMLPKLVYVLSLVTNADDQLFVLAGDYGPMWMFHVKEEGEAWMVEALEGTPIAQDLAIDAEGRLYAASGNIIQDVPVFTSEDEGRTWHPLVDGTLPEGQSAEALAVAVDADDRLYVGTLRNGVFRNKIDTETATESGAEIPGGLTLEAGYPNPFTRIVTIPFALPRTADVTLAVYDLLGRKVATLIDGERKPAGPHAIRWNAAGRPAGVYLYKLIADGTVKAGRMVLVK